VIIADGRFAWISLDTGQIESSAFLWSGILQGDSLGEVYVDGMGSYAVVAVQEHSISPSTGLVVTRARVIMYDAEAREQWSLPELESYYRYSVALTSSSVIVGTWPYGSDDNSLTAYGLFDGEVLWQFSNQGEGYQQLVQDGNRLYALISSEPDQVAAFDPRTGEQIWRWSDPEIVHPDLITLGPSGLFVMSGSKTVALDTTTGRVQWALEQEVNPIAGFAAWEDYVYFVPSIPGTSPNLGVMSLYADDGALAWHSLSGLFSDSLALGDEVLWAIVKDHNTGLVALSGLELETGLERVRLDISYRPDEFMILSLGMSLCPLPRLWLLGPRVGLLLLAGQW
jgi:outer membrane protein assembly factor BamB